MNNKCQVFTPEKYVDKMLDSINYIGKHIIDKTILENSCGEGNVLITIVRRYIEAAKKLKISNEVIEENLEKYIWGFEIDNDVRLKCIENLNTEATKYGLGEINWNVLNEDYLRFKLDIKMDFIVGNPPYIMYQNVKLDDRTYLKENFKSCGKGKFDYCYAFIEKSITELNNNGKMSYIVPNSIFKNVYGNELRNIMKNHLVEIHDYKVREVFENVLTSPAIICLHHMNQKPFIKYSDVDNRKTYFVMKNTLKDKWVFTDNGLGQITSSKKFGDFFKVSNSVATLLNSAFVINKENILDQDNSYIKLNDFYLEKEILRPAASPRGYSLKRMEYIIFPYRYVNGELKRFEEQEFKNLFPGVTEYLLSFAKKLSSRKSDKSARWFEYGRSQALAHLNQEKVMLSSVLTNEIFTYRLDENTIPYSGFYIVPIADKNLDEAIEILHSEEFFSYLSIRGINANGSSLRFSVNDILNYPLPRD